MTIDNARARDLRDCRASLDSAVRRAAAFEWYIREALRAKTLEDAYGLLEEALEPAPSRAAELADVAFGMETKP